jgi:hypothetical protein
MVPCNGPIPKWQLAGKTPPSCWNNNRSMQGNENSTSVLLHAMSAGFAPGFDEPILK